MVSIKTLESKYPKDYRTAFEDLATLMFCKVLGLSHGVNRRKNQIGIESDPIEIGSKIYGYQAKYYDDTTTLSKHKNDIIKCIQKARCLGVTNLLLFVNKDLPSQITNKKKITADEATADFIEPQFLQDIYDAAKGEQEESQIELDFWTTSRIESCLESPEFKDTRDVFFPDKDNNCFIFYEYVYKEFSEAPETDLYGNISLLDCYIEPTLEHDGDIISVREYIESFVNSDTTISVICGEPGHGKTSLCHKAMCDYYKNGWLANTVSNVFCFSLNPSTTDALKNNSFNLYPLLSWGDDRSSSQHQLKDNNYKNALILLDGFDELLESYQLYNIRDFIKKYIVPFQRRTNSHIILTSRNLAIEPFISTQTPSYGKTFPIYMLQPITRDQQIKWIKTYITHCHATSPEKAMQLEKYLDNFSKISDSNSINDILGIPIILRMIVEAQYIPDKAQSLTQIFDNLFEQTWIRLERKNSCYAEIDTAKILLANHAIRVFTDNNDTAETDLPIESPWLFSFYTTRTGKKRVGFLHRSFYQYFLAYKILSWYIEYASHENLDSFKEALSQLTTRRISPMTLDFIRNLYHQSHDKDDLDKSFATAYRILKLTDGILKPPSSFISEEAKPRPLESANNAFWNIVSIGEICGQSLSIDNINTEAFRLYNLSQCILSNAILCEADFNRACLSDADLHDADLRKTILSGANLSGANLSGANLYKTRLRGADLRQAYFCGAILRSADLSNVLLDEANLSSPASPYETNDDSANETKPDNNHYRKTNLSGAIIQNAKLRKANLHGTDLGNVHLEESNLRGADLSESWMRRAKLQNADLSGAILSNVNLERATLNNANLSGAVLTDANLSYANLAWANLNNANLSRANLTGADLSGINLNRTIMNNCIISRTKTSKSNVSILTSLGYYASDMIIVDD